MYYIGKNVERMMEMYSEELRVLDRNTVQYMVDQMQEKIDEQDKEIQRLKALLSQNGIDKKNNRKL